MEVVDTVYLIAYFKPSDPLHEEAARLVESLGPERKVSQAALIEFDLLMKSRGLSLTDRISVWNLLQALIDMEAIEPVSPTDLAVAAFLAGSYGMDYFDSIIASQCLLRKAEPLTTDEEITRIIDMSENVKEEMKKQGIL